MELQMKEMEIRDAEISRQLDEIIEREKGDILLMLGEDHCPSSKKAKMVRWEPRNYRNLAREISDSVRNLNKNELEELLFRHYLKTYSIRFAESISPCGKCLLK